MEQREVTDKDNTTWTCVQAYGGLAKEASEKATALAENDNGTIPVICTPGGGAKSVRLALAKDWLAETPDDTLLSEIKAVQEQDEAEKV